MKRQNHTDGNTPSTSTKIPAPRRSTTGSEATVDETNRARRNWKTLSTMMRDALMRKHTNVTATLGLFFLREQNIYSSLDSNFKITLPDDFNRASISDLSGFDNTGNVRLWPGGEGLSAFLFLYSSLVSEKSIIELGCGIFGLPGIIASRFAKDVLITDGNQHSVNVVSSILSLNAIVTASSAVLMWENPAQSKSFDVILAADCIFFKNSHKSFLDACSTLLSLAADSFVLLCSPDRKGSLTAFINFVKSDSRFTPCVHEGFTEFMKAHASDRDIDNFPIVYLLKRVE